MSKMQKSNELKAKEDAIRNVYTSTFITYEKAIEQAKSLGVDGERLASVLNDARGNYQVLLDFLSSVKATDRNRALCMLEAISTKDRSDVPLNVLKDHIKAPIIKTDLYNDYVLSPRVDVEFLSEYRAYFMDKYKSKPISSAKIRLYWLMKLLKTSQSCPIGIPQQCA